MINYTTKINSAPTNVDEGQLSAEEFNEYIFELENYVTNSGQTLGSTLAVDVNMISKATANYATGGNYFTEGGSVNAYTLAVVGTKAAPTSYFDGLTVNFFAGNANTGASTVNLASLGVKNIKRPDGSALKDGDIDTTSLQTITYKNGAGYFILSSYNTPASRVVKEITQATHGFAVGDWLYHNGTIYAKATADTDAHSQVVGLVTKSYDTNTFQLTTQGYVTGLSGLTAGNTYYLHQATAGAMTATAPSTAGQYVKRLFTADSTTTGYVQIAASTVVPATVSIPLNATTNWIDGLKLSWVSNDVIQISAGSCVDSTNASVMTLASTQNVDISTTGINKLDTGTQANSTWYFVWLCSGGSGTGAVLSTSSTAPTLPTGYTTYKRLLGAVYNSSGGNILEFYQIGKKNDRTFIWSVYRAVVTAGNPANNTWTSTATSGAFIPTAVTTTMLLHAEGYSGASGNGNVDALLLRTKGTTNTTYSGTVSSANTQSGTGSMDVVIKTDSSGDIDYQRSGTQTNFLTNLWANGFVLEI